jgi:Flp pilus assembly pilin Flp
MTVRGGGEDTVTKTSLAKRWSNGLRNLRNDERGAETGEYIMWGGLAIVAIGVIGKLLFDAFKSKATDISDCLDASSSDSFKTCNT